MKVLEYNVVSSVLPDPAGFGHFLLGSGSGRIVNKKKIRIRFRPDLNFNGSGSGRILAEIWPDPDPVSLEKLFFLR